MSALAGKRIVITRAAHQAEEFETLLLGRGAVPLLYPCIDIAPGADFARLDASIDVAIDGGFDWLVLTSANAVRMLKQCFDAMGIQVDVLSDIKVAAVGVETTKAVRNQLGMQVNLIPETYTAQALAQTLPIIEGTHIWLPQSALADSTLVTALSDRGALVTAVEAYRTVIGRGGVDLPSLLAAGAVDAITFTSGSTVTNLLQRLGDEGGDAAILSRLCLAYIGSKTAAVAREHHLAVTVVSSEHTVAGLVSALEDYYMQISTGESE